MIKISGVELPTPSDYSVGIMDLSKADRNTNGYMIGELIATKRKLELIWMFMEKSQLSRVLNLVAPMFFQVQYIDPQDDVSKSGTFYVSDRNMGALDYKDGNIRYKDIKFNLIER